MTRWWLKNSGKTELRLSSALVVEDEINAEKAVAIGMMHWMNGIKNTSKGIN